MLSTDSRPAVPEVLLPHGRIKFITIEAKIYRKPKFVCWLAYANQLWLFTAG